MKLRAAGAWIWRDALALMERAERLQRQFSRVGASAPPCWEPPVDVLESDTALIVHAALPGVPAATVVVGLEAEGVTITGVRPFPGPRAARLHRIEIPYGRFERQLALPMQALELASRELADGCLVLVFRKLKDFP